MLIEVDNIYKHYQVEPSLAELILYPFKKRKTIFALQQISFAVKSGEILGVVGHNGAGKTTLLRILANLLSPDIGKVVLCGKNLKTYSRSLRKNIGYASSDERSFFWRLTGRQNLEFFAKLYGVRRNDQSIRINKMLHEFNVINKANELFRDYSAGTRKKFSLMRSLLHEPQILLLDELTNSLDPHSTQKAKNIVRNYISTNSNRVAIWSTHRLEEIEQICDQVLVLEEGQVKYWGPTKGLYLQNSSSEYRSATLEEANTTANAPGRTQLLPQR